MSLIAAIPQSPVLLVAGVTVIFACACGASAAILDVELGGIVPRRRHGSVALLEREKDIAAGLGWPWQRWLGLRVTVIMAGLAVAALTGIGLLYFMAPAVGALGFRFALAGRAASRRLQMERAFLGQLRNLRDRMSVSNQSLDTALQEIGANPGDHLAYVMAPLSRGGSVVDNIVEMGTRARSPVVENAAGVLVWARSRSLDSLISAIEEVLLPIGEAQLAVQEETMVTLTQQRAVTFAMSALLIFMFAIVVRVDVFRSYYQSFAGQIVLIVVASSFAALVGLLGRLVTVGGWTRWDLRGLADQQERLGV